MSGRRTRSTRRPLQRLGAGLAAAAVVSLALPLGGGASAAPAVQTGASVVRTAGDPEFAGFAATAMATPVRFEVYEPTIPLPASPQGELNFGYAVVKADSSTSRGKASYLWPGDAVGEGFKTIAEQVLTPFGFPPQVTDPIYEAGYPIQVNSNYPAGPEQESDEQVPGSIQRTSASAEKTTALSGYSTDCKLGQEQPAEEDGGDGGEGPIPGLPDLPFPGLEGLTKDLTAVLAPAPAGKKGSSKASAEEEPACPIPAELTTIVDIGGFGAQTTVTRGADEDGVERVKAVSRSAVGEISLLLGIVQIDGLVATATTTSDGAKATTVGVTDYGTLTIAGQRFRYGSDGFEAAGTPQDIPGLPADPNQALEALGVQVLLPQPTEKREGDKGTTAVGGLQIIIDSTKVRQQLIDGGLPIGAISEAINGLPFPEEAGQIKSVLGAALNLSPKFVITLGNATSVVDTSPEIEIPTIDPGDTETDSGDTTTGGSAGTGSPAAPAGGAPVDAGAPAGSGGEPAIGDGALTDAAPAGAGLPELFSIPGALFFGGILGAAALGSYLRRLGILALGGGSSCSMGLEAGLPDLRKA